MSLDTGNLTVGTAPVELAHADTGGSLQRALMLQSDGVFYVGNPTVTADAAASTGGWKVLAGAVYENVLEPGERVFLRAATAGVVVNYHWSDV